MIINIRIALKNDLAKKFLVIKRNIGLKTNTETLRFLIKNFKGA